MIRVKLPAVTQQLVAQGKPLVSLALCALTPIVCITMQAATGSPAQTAPSSVTSLKVGKPGQRAPEMRSNANRQLARAALINVTSLT